MGAPDEPSTEMLPPAIPAGATAPAQAHALPTLIGRVLGGRFTIAEQLGKGGSGEVYRADQTQLGRSAVIKVLRRDLTAGAGRVERFLREAKLASRLDHPYASHIYAFGAETDNVLWIAMEHVRGVTLDELVTKRGAMPANIFAPLFSRLCEVVHTAHELGIVHRDIKGANVMVIERAGQLLPKLLDFGIAKFDGTEVTTGAASPGGADSELTAHGATLGSPHYMAPEQWSNAADVDARADIYALGVLAYRCLAGYVPFHTLARNQLAEAHAKQPIPPMPDFVTAPLVDAVERALAKQPAERWPTAVAFSDALVRAAGTTVKESVPLFDPATRDAWLAAGPQPIADALAHLTSATTTVEVDGALRDLVAITCRWLAVLGLAGLPAATTASNPDVRERARAVTGRDDGAPWLALARAAVAATSEPLPALAAALTQADILGKLAARLDERERARTAAVLAADIAAAAEALLGLEPLLAYQLVLGLADGVAESWQGPRRRERDRVLVWGPPLAPGEVALLDAGGKVVARLSPFAQVIAPLPAAEPELFLLWRSGRGAARLVAAPWGFERDDEHAGHVLAVLSTEESDSGPADDERSPYPGLAAYGVDDADHFVGREREVESLANRLVRSPLVAVLGPSGVGKSSFIHAGLVARLGEAYRVLTMRPGRHPMHALASLPPVSGDSHDDNGLAMRLRELGESAQRGLVLVIDQLEELVTLCPDPKERSRFAETIAAAASGPDAPVRVIATLRDDFATVIESEAALRGRFDVFVLAAPSPEALRRIVIEPARRANVTVDARVVDDMVTAVAGRPASLPLLSFTAAQLWKTRDRTARKITYDAYTELGGVAGALATYADQVYASLARRDQDTVRDLFARLVAADGTRIPSPRVELDQISGAPGVLAHLVDARLLVVRDDEGPEMERAGFTRARGTDVVEIVHECLAERWPRLARWRSEDAADRALLGDVRAAARRWHEGGRRPDELWRGEAVRELGRLAAHSTALTDVERAFAADAMNAQQRARRVRRGIVAAAMIVLAAAAAVMAYLGIAANENRAEAVRNASAAAEAASLAEERLTASLIAQGRRELNDNRAITALAYFAAAMKRGADSQGLRAMVSIATRGWKHIRMTYRETPINTVTGSPNGWIATGDQAGTVRWWSDAGTLLGQLTVEVGSISSVERQTDDGLVIVGQHGIVLANAQRQVVGQIKTDVTPWFASRGPAADEVFTVQPGEVRILGLDGAVRRTIPIPPGMTGTEPVFIAANTHMLVHNEDETLESIDMTTLARKIVAKRVWGEPTASADGSRFAYVDRNRNVHLRASDGREIKNLGLVARPNQVVFSPSGDRVGIVGDRDLTIFNGNGEPAGVFPIELDQTQYLLRGEDAWTTGVDGVLRHYRDGRLVASVPAHATEVQARAIGKDSLALVATDGSLVLVDAAATDIEEVPDPCERVAYTAQGIAAGYDCGDTTQLYIGHEKVAELPIAAVMYNVDYLPSAKRTAITEEKVSIFENGKRIAQADKPGPAAFINADELYVLEPKQSLWKWTVSSNAWARILAIGEVYAVAALADGPVIADKSSVIRIRGGVEDARVDVGADVAGLIPSPDRRWLAAHLVSGATAIIDTQTWKVSRTLPPADNYGAWPTFDASGELLLRSSRQAMSIWDHATGDELVFNFDLLRDLSNARFLPDGSLDVNRRAPGHLTIPRDSRPIDAILRDIDCRVPLEVVGSRVQPKTPRCQ